MVADSDRSAGLFPLRDFVDVVTSPWLFRPVTIVIYLAVTSLPTTASELGRLAEPSFTVAAALAAVSVAVLGALLLVAKFITPATLRRSRLGMLFVLMGVGAARGMIFSGFVSYVDVESESHLISRIFLGSLSLPPVLALVAVVVSRVTLSREAAARTQNEIATIEQTRNLILTDIANSDAQLLEQVDNTLRPTVDELSSRLRDLSSSRASIAHAFTDLANNVIRPLSHTLASSPAAARAHPPRAALSRRITAPGVPMFREQVSPPFVGLGVFLGSGTVLLDLLPPANAAIAAAVSGAVVFAVVRIVVALCGDERWSFLAVTITNSVVLSVAWTPAHLFNLAFLFPAGVEFNAGLTSFIAVPVLGLLYQLVVRGAYSGRAQLARLDDTRRTMAFQLSEARRRAWLRQRHLTHVLHSSVQSRVLAEARLVGSNSESLDAAERVRALETLELVLDTINDEPVATVDARQGITDLVEFWAGMCEIEFRVDPRVLSGIDTEVAESIQIVAGEMISNAIRHGKATALTLEIVRDTPDTIRMTASNNGQALKAERSQGLGTSLFDELTAEWSLREGQPVTIVAVIAARQELANPARLGRKTRKATVR